MQFTAVGAASMAVLLPGLALVRDTTAHDWYAAGKLTLTQIMLGVGVDDYSVTTYRTPDGDVMKIARVLLVIYGEPVRARERILSTVGNHAGLGAAAGAICGAVLLIALRRGGAVRRRLGVLECASGSGRPVFGQVWNRNGFIDAVSLPGWGEQRIGLVVLSPSGVEGVADVESCVDVGVHLSGDGIDTEQLAPGAEAARRALALTVLRGDRRADEQDVDSANVVEAPTLPAVSDKLQAREAGAKPKMHAKISTRKRRSRKAVKPAHLRAGRARAKKRSPGGQQNREDPKPAGRKSGRTQDIY